MLEWRLKTKHALADACPEGPDVLIIKELGPKIHKHVCSVSLKSFIIGYLDL